MIYAIVGDCGSGKTLLLAYLLYKDSQEQEHIYANIALGFKAEILTDVFFRDYSKFPIFNASVGFDELSMYYSARRTGSKHNQKMRPFILQTRKRVLTLYYTTQQMRLVDINIRENTDGFYFPSMLVSRGGSSYLPKPENWKHQDGDTYILRWKHYDNAGNFRPKRSGRVIFAEKLFRLYDTSQIIAFDDEEPKKEKKKKSDVEGDVVED